MRWILTQLVLASLVGQTPLAVASLTPPHLDVDVDAARVRKFVVVFDQDMDTSVHAVCGGGSSFPKLHRSLWQDARTFVMEVELEASRVYAMDLACAGSSGFRAKSGQMLAPTPWRIATTGPALRDGIAEQAINRLFEAIANHYSYRDRLGIDWSELERTHHDELKNAPHTGALALRLAQVLAAAQDPHISVRWNDATLPTYQRTAISNFDARGLHATFAKLDRHGRIGLSARTDDGIGYLFVSSFAREQQQDFELVLQALRTLRTCKSLVLDVRTNGGGDEALAKRLASFFVAGDKVYAAHRIRDPKAADGFQGPQERRVRGNPEPDVFTGPVAVLMGPLNMSSCEAFLLMMKQAPQAFLVGANSYGSSGNPQPHGLAPSLTVMLPSWEALLPDGSTVEGRGITPHIHVETKPADLVAKDPVLAEALLRLRGPR